MKRIVIIDDDVEARQLLRELLGRYCPEVSICGEADGVESGYALIRQTDPHGILLAVYLQDGTGFDLLDRFPGPTFRVVFTTAQEGFALRAFRYYALDYLLKPIDPVALIQAIDRLGPALAALSPRQFADLLESRSSHASTKIILPCLEGLVLLPLDQVVHLESDGCYTTFYLLNGERHLVCRPLKDFAGLFPEETFFQVHQSHLVRLASVKKILHEDGGYAFLEGGCKVPIARRRKAEFIRQVLQLFSR